MLLQRLFSLEKSVAFPIQGARFVFAGLSTASFDVGLLYLLTEVFGFPYLISSFISFLMAVTSNYVLSIKWVFIDGKFSRRNEYLLFLTLSGGGLLLNQFIIWISVEILFLHYMTAKILSIGLVTLWNFFGKKKVVFSG